MSMKAVGTELIVPPARTVVAWAHRFKKGQEVFGRDVATGSYPVVMFARKVFADGHEEIHPLIASQGGAALIEVPLPRNVEAWLHELVVCNWPKRDDCIRLHLVRDRLRNQVVQA